MQACNNWEDARAVAEALGYPIDRLVLEAARAWLYTMPAREAVGYIKAGVRSVHRAKLLFEAGVSADQVVLSGMGKLYNEGARSIEDIESFFINML